MSEPKFTPGEWVVLPPKKTGKRYRIAARATFGGGGAISSATALWTLATIGNGAPGDTLETEGSNAQLMAAAKDLYAACEAFMELFMNSDMRPEDESHEVAAKIRAALAKAKGV